MFVTYYVVFAEVRYLKINVCLVTQYLKLKSDEFD